VRRARRPMTSAVPGRGDSEAADRRRFVPLARRYDAAPTIAAFSEGVRQQFDPETVATKLLASAEHRMQPTQQSLWLQPLQPGRG
ncbi:MAG TPA: hypothetical protein VFZ70_01025, partial [Euzebyales bacterium]